MSFSFVVCRKATQDDHDLLNRKACAFVARHALNYPKIMTEVRAIMREPGVHEHFALTHTLDSFIFAGWANDVEDAKYLLRLWTRIFRRAVNEPQATRIAWGAIGFSQKQ